MAQNKSLWDEIKEQRSSANQNPAPSSSSQQTQGNTLWDEIKSRREKATAGSQSGNAAVGQEPGVNPAKGTSRTHSWVYDKADSRVSPVGELGNSPYKEYLQREDYKQKSQATGSKKRLIGGDELYDYINNIGDERQLVEQLTQQGRGDKGYAKYAFMTEDEVGIYNYLYATEGKKAAKRFLNSIDPGLNEQWFSGASSSMADAATKSGANRAAFSALTVAAQPVRTATSAMAGVQDWFRVMNDREIDPYSPLRRTSQMTQSIRNAIAEQPGFVSSLSTSELMRAADDYALAHGTDANNPYIKAFTESSKEKSAADAFLYQTVMSAADSAVNMWMAQGLAQGITGLRGIDIGTKAGLKTLQKATNFIGAFTMSNEVMSLGVAEAKQKINPATGKQYSDLGALGIGLLRGAVEFASEAIGGDWAVKMINKDPLNFTKTMLRVMIPEGVEEVMSDVANGIFNLIIDAAFGTQESGIPQLYDYYVKQGSQNPWWDVIKELLGEEALSFLGGALATFGTSSAQTYNVQQGIRATANRMNTTPEAVVQLMNDYQTENPGDIYTLSQRFNAEDVESFRAAAGEGKTAANLLEEQHLKDKAEAGTIAGKIRQGFRGVGHNLTDAEVKILADGFETGDADEGTYLSAIHSAYNLGKSGNFTLQEAIRASSYAGKINETQFRHAFELGASQALTDIDTVDVNTEEGQEKLAASLSSLGNYAGEAAAAYEAGQDVNTYAEAMYKAASLYVANGKDLDAVVADARSGKTSNIVGRLTDAQIQVAKAIGEKMRAANQEQVQKASQQRAAAREANTAGEKRVGNISIATESGSIEGMKYNAVDESKLNKSQKNVMRFADTVAKVLGLDITVVSGEGTFGGAYSGNGKIYLNINSGMNLRTYSKVIAAASLGHEIVHSLKDRAEAEYEALKQRVIDSMSADKLEELVQEQLRTQPNLTYDGAVDEVVANACQTLLQNSEALKQLARESMTTAEKIQDVIHEFVEKIHAAFAEVDYHDNLPIFHAVQAVEKSLDEIQKDFDNALIAAKRNADAEVGGNKKAASEGGTVFQIQADTDLEETNIEDGRAAIEKLMSEAETSDDPESLVVENAMYRSDLGPIDFKWGTPGRGDKFKGGYGLSHIIAKRNAENGRGVEIANRIVEAIAKAKTTDTQFSDNLSNDHYRIRLYYEDITAVLNKDPGENHWLLTGWENNETAPSATGEVHDSAGATADTTTRTRRSGDAAVSDNRVAQNGEEVKGPIQKQVMEQMTDPERQAQVGPIDLRNYEAAKGSDGESLFQVFAFEHDEPEYRAMLEKAGLEGVDIDNLFNTVDVAMGKIMANLEVLDYAWERDIDDRVLKTVKPNSDHLYKVSIDFSTLCRKRIMQGLVQYQLQAALNRALTQEEGIAIRDALVELQKEGLQIEVACALCYVESARMKSPAQIQKFLDNREQVIREYFAGKSRAFRNEAMRQAEQTERNKIYEEMGLVRGKGIDDNMYDVRDPKAAPLNKLPVTLKQRIQDAKKAAKAAYTVSAEQQKIIDTAKELTISDFTTPEGLENLAKNHRELYDAYTSYVRNATKSKGIENDVWWRVGDSKDSISDNLIAQMNAENGLRTQSWSDFQVIHMMDYIAQTIELSTRHAKQHAYTKVIDYVDLMGQTGVMINMSLIPAAVYNGELTWDDVEGIVSKEAFRMREKYHATAGTIAIGINNNQIRQLLASGLIDYVIPYHHSGMSKAVRLAMHIPGWDSYQDYQNEKKLSRSEAERNASRYGAILLPASDPNYHKAPAFSEWFDLKEAQRVVRVAGKEGKYGIMTGGYQAMQEAAERYKQMCAERGLAPKFSYGAGDFSTDDNYWKLLIDRKMVDNVTGDIIEQKALKPIFDLNVINRILDDELARYGQVKQDQDEAIRRVSEAFLSGKVQGGMSVSQIAEAMQKPVDNVTNVNITESAKLQVWDDPEVKAKAEKAIADNNAQTETGSQLRTLAGSPIRRGGTLKGKRYPVGKIIGNSLYIHKNYIDTATAVNQELGTLIRNAEQALREAYPDFEYNAIAWRTDDNQIQFQQAPDFDTAREPVVGLQMNVDADGTVTPANRGKPFGQIWHHKWEWVGNDYTGFDVNASWNWSRQWLNTIVGPSKGGSLNAWNNQLNEYQLPQDQKTTSKFQLILVDPVQPSSDAWQRTMTEPEALAIYPDMWDTSKAKQTETEEEKKKRDSTQRANTLTTYRKIYEILQRDGFSGKILDASSGLGLGTQLGRNEFGFDVTDIEPYPDPTYKPMYTDYSTHFGQYDAIISSAVLNVLAQDQRDALVVKMGQLLKPGGKMYVTTRTTKGDVDNLGKTGKNIQLGPSEYIETVHNHYQKGFTNDELQAYLQDALGDDFVVEIARGKDKFNNNTAVIVTKKAAEQMAPAKLQTWDGVEKAAVEHFGTTKDFRTAGYMLQDGRLLDFSGAHWLEGYDDKYIAEWRKKNDIRQTDHEDIFEAYESMGDDFPNDSALDFIKRGNIRMVPEISGIELSAKTEPTAAQYAKIKEYVNAINRNPNRFGGNQFTIDYTENRKKTNGMRYTGTINADRVVNDIKYYYATGKVRDQGLSAFLQVWDETADDTASEKQGRQSAYARLQSENQILRDTVKELKRTVGKQKTTLANIQKQLQLTKTPQTRLSDARKLAKAIIAETGSKAADGNVAAAIKRLGDYILNTQADQLNEEDLKNKARAIAREVLDSATETMTLEGETMQVNPYDAYMGEATEDLANRIVMDAMNGVLRPTAPTKADKQQARTQALKDRIQDLIKENKLQQREGASLYQTIYDLSLQLDKAQSRYETLRQNANRRVAEVRAEGAARAAEVKATERARAEGLLEEQKQHYLDIAKRARERRETAMSARAFRSRIMKLYKEFVREIQHPTEAKHIPPQLMQQAADILSVLNMDNSREGSKAGQKLKEKLATLKATYDGIQKDPDFRAAAAYDPIVSEMMQTMIDQVGDTPINQMSVQQLEIVYNVLKAMQVTAKNAMKIQLGNEERDAYQASVQMTNETRSSPNKAGTGLFARWLNSQLSPERMFHRLGGYHKNSMWSKVYQMLNGGQLKSTQIFVEGSRIFDKLMGGRDYDGFVNPKNTVDIGLKDENGNTAYLTHGMMVSLYMHLQNEDNTRHAILGGVEVPALKDYYNGKKTRGTERAVRVGGLSLEAVRQIDELREQLKNTEDPNEQRQIQDEINDATEEALAYADELRSQIEQKLTDYDRQWITALRILFDQFSKDQINATTMDVYGIKKAGVDNYYPIWVDGDFLNTPFESIARDFSIENVGFLKERVTSNKPIRLADASEVAASQLKKVAQYCGLMPVIRDFNKIWGKTQRSYSDSLKKAVHSVFGETGVQYIDNLMADLNGARGGDDGFGGEIFNRLRGHMAQAALTLSMRTAFGQTASYPTAASVVGWGPLLKALARGGKNNTMISRADQALIEKYSPLLAYRMKGYSSIELGDIASSNSRESRLWKKFRWLTGWIQAMDGATVGRLWYAAEYYVQDHNKDLEKGTDAYYREVAKVFNDIVEKTQPDYTTMQRPDILRNPNALVRSLTMFMTQRLQNFNIVYDAAANLTQAKKDYAAGRFDVTKEDVQQAAVDTRRAVVSQLAAGATIVAFKFLADAILHNMNAYRDDDKELTEESVSLQLLNMFLDSVIGNFLWGGELYDLVESRVFGKTYYGIEVSSVSTVTDMVKSFNNLVTEMLENGINGEKFGSRLNAFAKDLSSVLGIPLANAEKIILGVVYHAQDIANGEFGSFDAGVSWLSKTKAATWKEKLEPLGITQRQFSSMLDEANADGNSNLSQDELGAWLIQELANGNITEEQAKAYWAAAGNDWKKTFDEWRSKPAAKAQSAAPAAAPAATPAPAVVSNYSQFDDAAPIYGEEKRQAAYDAWANSLQSSGMSLDEYTQFLQDADTDGNNSIKQDEMGYALYDKMQKGELTFEEADAIWRSQWNNKRSTYFEKWLRKNGLKK